jgi:hypothetical protein
MCADMNWIYPARCRVHWRGIVNSEMIQLWNSPSIIGHLFTLLRATESLKVVQPFKAQCDRRQVLYLQEKACLCNWLPVVLSHCTSVLEVIILGAFVKFRKATISFFMSVCPFFPRGATRLPLDGFSWNLIFEYFFQNISEKFKFH